MCYDKDTSLLAWTLSYTIAWYLFNRNQNYDRWNASFILCFTTVQLIEAGIWCSKESNGASASEFVDLFTRLLLLALLMQPLIQSYMGYQYTPANENSLRSQLRPLLGVASLAFLALLFGGMWRIGTSTPGQFTSTVG